MIVIYDNFLISPYFVKDTLYLVHYFWKEVHGKRFAINLVTNNDGYMIHCDSWYLNFIKRSRIVPSTGNHINILLTGFLC